MKKFAAGAGATVVALAGLSGLSIAPAVAAPGTFDNCAEVYAAGEWRISSADPRFTPGLDGDGDGFGCDNPKYRPAQQTPATSTPQNPSVTSPQAPAAADPAAVEPWTWDNCSEAFANGVSNIPAGTRVIAPGSVDMIVDDGYIEWATDHAGMYGFWFIGGPEIEEVHFNAIVG